MSACLVDTNIFLDIVTLDVNWHSWAADTLLQLGRQGPLCINPIIYAEIAPAFTSPEALDAWLGTWVVERRELPYSAAWLASMAFVKYRQSGGVKTSTLGDFFIGAQAEVEGLTIVTRDASRYRTYFSIVHVVTP